MKDRQRHSAFDGLFHSFEHYPDRIALVDKDGRTITYEQFRQLIVSARKNLTNHGIKKDDRVLVFVPMSIELYAYLEAIFSLGAVAIFLDPWMKGRRMGQVIKQVKPKLLIATKKIKRLAWLLPATWWLKKLSVNGLVPLNSNLETESVTNEDCALITFTSGTSGTPKGANRNFAFLEAQLSVLKSHLVHPKNEHYVELTNFPIVGLAAFAMGNTVVIPDVNLMKIHEADAVKIIDQIKTHQVNRIISSPALLSRIVHHKHVTELKGVEEIVTGGAPISRSLIQETLKQFPTAKCEGIYGSTESEPISITDFATILQNWQTPLNGVFTGKPVDAVSVKIIQISHQPVEPKTLQSLLLREGETGEVIVTGDHVNKNYYENPGAFRRNKIIDEQGEIWHRTGDLGYLKNGELFLTGRDHRVVTHQGKSFHPYPLEQLMEKEFGYADSGYVQTKRGKIILYIGSCNSAPDFAALMQAIRLAGYPVDEIKTSVKPLPRDARHRSKLQNENLI